MGYSTERRRVVRAQEIERKGLTTLNRMQEVARAKKRGYVSQYLVEKYDLTASDVPYLASPIVDGKNRYCALGDMGA